MKYLKSVWLFLLLSVAAFYALPACAAWYSRTGHGGGIELILTLIILPIVCFVLSALAGLKSGFHLIYPIGVCFIFAPTIFIFYNPSAWVFIIGYGVIALIGNATGGIFEKRKKKLS